ncbi:carboxypeptidase-like regulatory domain-containing protein [Algoriphagus sp. AGSA1]|uniref:carboxypeptidase-like regulatory domain-containing protein n=1 Tax=Algoriphagus sp. AGSA1 TaxID=2907213 RepID=UPI001F2604CD|nr:carboxypeptidase-like regulatory domain-containing protein [Algoriphagus sp. AGSA1]MCE7057505.1 carboxypeptidase-like regulatory domain-containing protein [Algoriphagus sp. AGSA1]
MRFLVFSVFFICVHFVAAQNQQANNLSGVIIDSEDSAPVPFAYLYLKNYPGFSALADEQGEFKFFFPSQFMDEMLVVSCIGYEKKEVSISSLSATANKLSLQRQFLSLNEVTVMPEGNSIEGMISKAIDNIPKNYPDKRHQLRGFYRKISTNYEEFTKLVEAAVLVEDVSYKKDGLSLRIKLESLRQSDELGEVDSSMSILKQRIREHIKSTGSTFGPLNEIIGIYQYNGFRGDAYNSRTWFGKDGGRFMGIPELPTYHRIMGEEIVGKDTIYQIAFGGQDPPNGRSYLKINSRNHAIVEYQFRWASGEYEHFAKFREVDGLYYPEMIRNKELRLINRDVGTHQMNISTFWFDVPMIEDLKKIRAKDALGRDEEVESKKYELDSNFWKTYDLIKKYPLDSAIIRNLEKDSSLEEQFRNNAKD